MTSILQAWVIFHIVCDLACPYSATVSLSSADSNTISNPRPKVGSGPSLRTAVSLLLRDRKAFWWNAKVNLLRYGCRLFARTPFYLQGKMDLDSRSWWHNPAFVQEAGGFALGDGRGRKILEIEAWDTTRRDMIILLLRSVVERGVEGDFAELGVYKGYSARLVHHYAPERALHLFDTFVGFDSQDVANERAKTGLQANSRTFSDTSVELVLGNIAPQNGNVHVYPGRFPESVPMSLNETTFALAHLDADLYEPILAGLEFFYPRVTSGGFILVHDFNSWPGARKAVLSFLRGKREIPIPMPDKSGSALIVKA